LNILVSVNGGVLRLAYEAMDGDPSRAQEVSEFWTFRRSRGGAWMLSAIQQV
jgi:predicted lipid-binding transport protein (Tim44 family)